MISVGVEPGHHLVEQDQFRFERERARDFEAAALAQREFAGRHFGARLQPDFGEHRGGGRIGGIVSRMAQERADHDVLARRQADQRLGDLEGAPDAALRAAHAAADC